MIKIILDFWKFAVELIWGKPPPAKVTVTRNDDLPEDSATRGVLILGDPGSGKTRYAMMQLIKAWIKNPHPMVMIDWSGSSTNTGIDIISRQDNYEQLLENVVVDELGNE